LHVAETIVEFWNSRGPDVAGDAESSLADLQTEQKLSGVRNSVNRKSVGDEMDEVKGGSKPDIFPALLASH
jgi:hypothetical protein